MGIAGSIISPEFFEEYLGMRVESVDEVEIIRRMTEGIYDHAEFEKALAELGYVYEDVSESKAYRYFLR